MLSEADLLRRQKFITSSNAAALLNLDEFGKTPVDVYWEKVSPLAAKQEERKDFDLGHRLEDVLCEWGASRLGGVTFDRQVWVESIDGLMASTIDGVLHDRPEGLEAKYSGEAAKWGDEGTDQIPTGYLIQAQHHCYACNLDRVWVPALVIGYRAQFRLYVVERNDELIESIVDESRRFWRDHVEPRIPPDGNPIPPAAVLKKMRRQQGKTVTLDDAAAVSWEWLEHARTVCTEAEHQKQAIEAAVLAHLGDAEHGTLPDGRTINYASEGAGHSTDVVLLRALAPDVYAEVVTPRTRRMLRVKKPRTRGA